MDKLSLISNTKSIRNMTYNELKADVVVIQLNSKVVENRKLHHELLTELNFKSYEEKLDGKNRPNLGPISRGKYNKIKLLSEVILPDDIFQRKDKFKTLNKIINK